MEFMQKAEDNFQESVLPLHHVGPGISLSQQPGSECLYLLRNLAGSLSFFFLTTALSKHRHSQ